MGGSRTALIVTAALLGLGSCRGEDYSLGGLRAPASGGTASNGGAMGAGGAGAGPGTTGGRPPTGGAGPLGGSGGDIGGAGGDGGVPLNTGGRGGVGGNTGGTDGGNTGGAGGANTGGTEGGISGGKTFIGTIDGYTFASGSSAIEMVFDQWPDARTGTVLLGVAGFERPPTDPVEAASGSGASGVLYEGFRYSMTGDPSLHGDHLSFGISAGDIWGALCGAARVYPNADTASGYSCVPKGDFQYPDDCSVAGEPVSCASIALCAFLGACVCSATACRADPSQPVPFDVTVQGTKLEGTVRDIPQGGTSNVHLTEQ
jgi:hypothetical protein